MKSRLLSIIAAAGLVACAHGNAANTSSQPQDESLLAVTNDHWLDMNIYALRGGSRQRIGTVPGFKTDTLPLRLTIVAGGSPIRLTAEAIGLNARHVTEPIQVAAGEIVEFRIKDPLNLSNVMVVRR